LTEQSLAVAERQFAMLRSGTQPEGFDPYPLYHEIRQSAPVWHSPWGDWYLSSYAAVAAALTHPACDRSPWGRQASRENRPSQDSPIASFFGEWLLFCDPCEHEKLRQELLKPFASGSVAALQPVVTELCQSLVPDDGSCFAEIVGTIAQPFPAALIARLIGIPRADLDLVADWARLLRTVLDDPIRNGKEAEPSLRDMRSYFFALVKDPAWIRSQSAAGNRGFSSLANNFPPEVAAANLELLVFSGHETTVHLIGSLLFHLALRPQMWTLLRARPDLIHNAVSEALRLESPIQKICRWSQDRFEISNVAIPPFQTLVLLLGAANRDPARFADPDSFDIGRDCSNHLAFGRSRHLCLGRSLAMLEASILLGALLERWTAVALVEDGWQWLNNSSFRGLRYLKLEWRQAEPWC
jgi:cytochrome P450